jgi:PAS domain S-box-containing protein
MSLLGKAFLLGVLMWLWFSADALAAAPEGQKRVLVLYDENMDFPGLITLDRSLKATFKAASADAIEVYSEFMDLARFESDRYFDLLRDLYRQKYAPQHIDLLIAAMGPSLNFLLRYGDELFPGIPIVFCGIDRRELGGRNLEPHVTGILARREFKGTLNLALRLHPQSRRVIVIGGTSDFDKYWEAEARREFREFEDRLAFTYLTDLAMQDILHEVAHLPEDTIIFYLHIFKDNTAQTFIPHEALARITEAAKAPVYAFVDQYLGQGIVGGHLFSLDKHGTMAAELGLRILAGERSADIPIVEGSAAVDIFDWRQLRRWGISEDRLPPGSIVRYKVPSAWDQYQTYFIGGTLLCSVEALLILGLLVHRKRRRHTEALLEERLRFEMLEADVAAALVNQQPDDPAGQIRFGLRRVTEFLDADQGNLSEYVESVGAFRVLHSYAADGFEPLPSVTNVEQYPWCVDQLRHGSSVRCSSLEELPEAAAVDRQTFRERDTKSVILVPLTAGDVMLGSLSFVSLRAERTWTDEQAQRLRPLGEIFANALLRRRAEVTQAQLTQEIERERQRLNDIVTTVPGVVWEAWEGTDWAIPRISFVSQHVEEMLGYRTDELLSTPHFWLTIVHEDDREQAAREAAVILASGKGASWQFRCVARDGRVLWAEAHIAIIRDEAGKPIGVRGVTMDITARKLAEEALQNAQAELTHAGRLLTMGELAASLAHEINQPLTAILSNVRAAQRFLAAEPPNLAEVRAILADVVEDDQRAGEVICRLRSFLKKSEPEFQPLNLNQVIREVVRIINSDVIIRNIALVLQLDPGLPPVRGDRVQLQQVILNLMLNGFDVMTELATDDRRLVVRTQRADAHTVQMAVQDCGRGIEADKLDRVFEPFYTTKREGMGMGLSICRSIVEAHGGSLWATNNPDRGATFYFSLPVSEEKS